MSEFRVAARLQRYDLHKLHGLGNDFLVWFRPDVPDDAPERARKWCNRHTGVGADGLIVAIDHRRSPTFVLFNADGGRAEISGNGLRCFIHALAGRRGLDELEAVVQTDTGERRLTVRQALSETATATVDMGSPEPGPSLGDFDVSSIVAYERVDTIDLGNPHTVIQVADLDAHDIAVVGPAVEAHFLPTGINVHLVQATDDGARIAIWERGVGVTQACGSGASVTAAILGLERPDRESLNIAMPGGTVRVDVGDTLQLHGPSSYVAAIEVPEPVIAGGEDDG